MFLGRIFVKEVIEFFVIFILCFFFVFCIMLLFVLNSIVMFVFLCFFLVVKIGDLSESVKSLIIFVVNIFFIFFIFFYLFFVDGFWFFFMLDEEYVKRYRVGCFLCEWWYIVKNE